jgi:predicted protein tyrosine phosphatase
MSGILMPGMSRLSEYIYLGDANDVQTLVRLDGAADITAICNLTDTTDNLPAEWKDRYLRLNQGDGMPISKATIFNFLDFMIAQREANRTILIHCAAGVSRTSAFAILWLMFCGFSWDEAEAMVQAARPIISPNPVLKESILAFFAGGTP